MTKRKSKRNFVQGSSVPKKKKARTRKHEICNCNLCKGAKVDPRTKALHMKKGERDLGTRNLIEPTDVQIEEGTYSYIDVAVSDGPMEIDARSNNSDSDNSNNEPEFNFLVKKPKKQEQLIGHSVGSTSSNITHPLVLIEQFLNINEDNEHVNEDKSDSEYDNNEQDEQTVNFDAPDIKDHFDNIPIASINQGFAWIVIWILKYQERYRLPDTATDSLIKFIRYMLILQNKTAYSEFPTSLYMARKLFGINDQAIKYATCKKCCKLYAIKDLPTDEPYHCTYQDFLNHPMANLRSPCNAIIIKQVAINQYRPSLIFPITNIKHQLQ
jgi:hypothetical protein